MRESKKTCDLCGRAPDTAGPCATGPEYHWATLRLAGRVYCYDDGTEEYDKRYDLCRPCKMRLFEFLDEEDPVFGTKKEARKRYQAKVRRGYRNSANEKK